MSKRKLKENTTIGHTEGENTTHQNLQSVAKMVLKGKIKILDGVIVKQEKLKIDRRGIQITKQFKT